MRARIVALPFALSIGLAAAGIPLASAQEAAPAAAPGAEMMKVFTSAADVKALIAQAKADRKGDQPSVSKPILRLAPYRVNLEYRPGTASASLHEKDAELMYVIEGAGTVVIGGTLVDEKRRNAANLSGTRIEGGEVRAIKQGDFFIVPEKTAHQIIPLGDPIVVMTFHVPRPPAGQ